MTELLKAKMQEIDNMSIERIKADNIIQFNEFAEGLSGLEAKALLIHYFDRLVEINQKLPNVEFGTGYIEEISCDFNVMEVIHDHRYLQPRYQTGRRAGGGEHCRRDPPPGMKKSGYYSQNGSGNR